MYNNNIIVKDVININNIDCILFYFQNVEDLFRIKFNLYFDILSNDF